MTEVGKSLHSPKKEFFVLNKKILEELYKHYDKLADRDELHKLTKLWEIKAGDDEAKKKEKSKNCELANQLYGDSRSFVNNHWEYIKQINGGETPYCPICGLHECEEMDHFVPRDEKEYPEYAAHLSNLIPLCHNCNHKKSTKFLDNSGGRIFFNAFYDVLTNRDILSCKITISPKDGLPQIQTMINSNLSASNKPDVYVISTIDDLDLMKRFSAKAKELFKQEMNRLSLRVGQPWDIIKNELKALSKPMTGDPDIVLPAVLGAIAESVDMEKWFKSL